MAAGGSAMFKAYTQYQEEAQALAIAEADLGFDEQAQRVMIGDSSTRGAIDAAFEGTTTTGIMSERGNSAIERSDDAIQNLEKARDEVAETLKDERAREKFLLKTNQKILHLRAQIERHVSSQVEEMKVGTVKALEQRHLSMSAAGVSDFDAWIETKKQLEETLRNLAPSQEIGEAAVRDFQSRDAEAFVHGLVAQGNTSGAVQFADAHKDELGLRYEGAKRFAQQRGKEAQLDGEKARLATMVSEWADEARDENGFVPEDVLREKATQLSPNDPGRDELDAMLNRQVRYEREKLEAGVKSAERSVERAAFIDRAPLPSKDVDFLRRYAPERLVAIREHQLAEFRRWKKEKDGTAEEKAEARRAQANVDEMFAFELETELIHNPQADPREFESKWVARRVKNGEEYTTPSEVAKSKAGLSSAKAQRSEAKGEAADRRSFAFRIERDITAMSKKRGKPFDEALLNERVGRALIEYDRRLEAKGSPLNENELTALEADMLRYVVTEPGWLGTSIGQKQAWGVDVVDAGTPEPVKQRIRVIRKSDGQIGTLLESDFNPDEYVRVQ